MQNKIFILGEAYGEQEEAEQAPFVGTTGWELTRMLDEAGIRRADCYLSNVFNRRPRANKIEDFCGGKETAIRGYPFLIKGKFVRSEFTPELDRLGDELVDINPNLIIAMGNTAAWALLGRGAISKIRGNTTITTHTVEGFKVLPTYHPAAVFRQWGLRPIVIMDLLKAVREQEYPEIRRPKRTIWIEPTIEDIHVFDQKYLLKAERISVDIETAGNQITCIGFAPTKALSIVIPFYDPRRLGRNYWATKELEKQAWAYIQEVLKRRTPKIFQNGLYDIAFLWRAYGIKVFGATDDTMLLHHALQPESLKGLQFLGSLYTDEGSWKSMRTKHTTIKKDD